MSNKIIGTKDIGNILKKDNMKGLDKIYEIYKSMDKKSKTALIDKFIDASKSTNEIYKYILKSIYLTKLILKNEPTDENLYRLIKLIEYQYNKCEWKEKLEVASCFRDNIIVENYMNFNNIKIRTNRPIQERENIAQLFLYISFKFQNSKYITQEIKKSIIKFIENSLLVNIKDMDLNEKVIDINEINEILKINKSRLSKENNKNIDNDEKKTIKKEVKEKVTILENKIDKNTEKELEGSVKLNQIKSMFDKVCLYIDNIEKEKKINEENIKLYNIRCENEKEINNSLKKLIESKDEELNKLKLESNKLRVSLEHKESEYNNILNKIYLLKLEKEKIEKEIKNKDIEIDELKEKSIKLANINTREANNEFSAYKNKLSSKLKIYYSEFQEGKDSIPNESDKAQFLQDQLDDIFRILINSDIKLK